MNFRIVLHLIKTDWQRLKWPVIGLWVIVVLTALPWFMHDPTDFEFPNRMPEFGRPPKFLGLIHGPESIGSILGLYLAAMIGLQVRGRILVSPIRIHERATARFLTIFLFLVLPPAICVGLNLIRQGFPVTMAMHAMLAFGITILMILGVTTLFAAWCSTAWQCLVGVTAVIGAHALYSMMPGFWPLPPLELLSSILWPTIADYQVLGTLALATIVLGLPLLLRRGRMNGPLQVATAVILLMLALAASVIPSVCHSPNHDLASGIPPNAPATMIRPVIRPESLRMVSTEDFRMVIGDTKEGAPANYNHASSSVAGIVDASGCPPGQFVVWKAAEASRLTYDGRIVAKRVPHQSYFNTRSGGDHPLSDVEPDDLAVITEALPAKTPPDTVPKWNRFPKTERPNYLGCYVPIRPQASWDEGALTLETSFTGTVYQYERIIDVPLTDNPVRLKVGDAIYQIRHHTEGYEAAFAELTITRPALGFMEQDISSEPARMPMRCFLHVPGSNVNLAVDTLSDQSGSLLSGARWQRQVFGHRWLASMNRMIAAKLPPQSGPTKEQTLYVAWMNSMFSAPGVRLVILKPTVVGHVPATPTKAEIIQSRESQRDRDYALNYDDGMNEWIFLRDHLATRPDPRTCTKAEFGRWLRIAAGVQIKSLALTGYGKRFSDVLARAPDLGSLPVIEAETPESSRAAVLNRLDDIYRPAPLIGVVSSRGWADEGALAIRNGFLHRPYSEYSLSDVMALEDPATYPKLIEHLIRKPNLALYELMRLLPGIEPDLNQAITRAMANPGLAEMQAQAEFRDPTLNRFNLNLLAAKQGDSMTLDAVLATHKVIEQKEKRPHWDYDSDFDRLISAVTPARNFRGWSEYLIHKSAADFRYDSTRRKWLPALPH